MATSGAPLTHAREEVAAELADVALTAPVAIESLGLDARQILNRCVEEVVSRLDAPTDNGSTAEAVRIS